MTQLLPSVIETDRLILVPLDDETALHLIGGDPSCLDHVADWPHDDTVDGVRLRARGGLVWLVGLGGVVIGDCGTAGPVADRTVEIGFGLAESQRSRGFGTELVAALSDWLLLRVRSAPSSPRPTWETLHLAACSSEPGLPPSVRATVSSATGARPLSRTRAGRR